MGETRIPEGRSTAIQMEPMVVYGGGSRSFPESAPEVDRAGKRPLSRTGGHTLDNLYTLRLNLEQRFNLAVRQGERGEADRLALTINRVDEAIGRFDGSGPVRDIERRGAADLRELSSFTELMDTIGSLGDTVAAPPPAPETSTAPSGPSSAPTAPTADGVVSGRDRLIRSSADFASLRALGFDVGTAARPNRTEIQRFQRFCQDNGISVNPDGRYGPATAAAVAALVTRAQENLASTGHDPGTADGRWGPQTQAAFQAYAQASGRPSAEALRVLVAPATPAA